MSDAKEMHGNEKMERVNITIPADLMTRIRDVASREHRSFSGQVAYLAERGLETGNERGAGRS